MSDWITDRLPTKADGDCNGRVWVTSVADRGFVSWELWDQVSHGDAWCCTNRPEPYEPPKPERRELRLFRSYGQQWRSTADNYMGGAEAMNVREVLPGDPTPEAIDELATELEELKLAYAGCEKQRINLAEIVAKLRGETD